jgi:hypothetical protein
LHQKYQLPNASVVAMAAKDEEEEKKVHRYNILYPSQLCLCKSGLPTVGQLPPHIFFHGREKGDFNKKGKFLNVRHRKNLLLNITQPTWATRRAADRYLFRAATLTQYNCNQIGGIL